KDPLTFARSARLEREGDKTRVRIQLAPGSTARDFRNQNSIVFDVQKGAPAPEKATAQPAVETADVANAGGDKADKSLQKITASSSTDKNKSENNESVAAGKSLP